MTTIAYRKGVLAGDTCVTTGDMIDSNVQRKVYKLRDGSLFGAAGTLEQIEMLKQAVVKKTAMPKLDDISALKIEPDGTVSVYEGNLWIKQKPRNFFAVGSGSVYAVAAMMAGADAKKAVQIAIALDTYSGGRVQTVKLKGN